MTDAVLRIELSNVEPVKKILAILGDALSHVAADGCENYTGSYTCSESIRERDAEFSAERWCSACVAADALKKIGAVSVGGEDQ